MRIGVVGNCTSGGLGMALRQLCEDAEVLTFEAIAAHRENRLQEAADVLTGCDIIFSHLLPREYGALSTDVLRAVHGNLQLVPAPAFTGFHPDCIYISKNGIAFDSALGPYHSGIAAAAFDLGLYVDEALALFNAEVYGKLGYFEEFAKARIFLTHVMDQFGLDIAGEWASWMARAPFMHTINHPKGFLVASIAKLVAIRNGLVGDGATTPELAIDELSLHAQWPTYPEIGAPLGIRGSYLFKRGGAMDLVNGEGIFYGLPEFIERSFSHYSSYCEDVFQVPEVARRRSVLETLI